MIASAAALAAAVAVALSGLADPFAATQPSAAARPKPSAPAGSADATHDLSRFFDEEFPSTFEEALLERLLEDVARTCERADPEDTPEFRLQEGLGAVQPYPLRFRAGLSCLTNGTRVLYWQASDSVSVVNSAHALFFDVAARMSLPEGDCATESRVRDTWQAGLHSGQVLCYVNADRDAVIEWTFDDANIYATARRRGGETRALYEWWRETGVALGD